MLTRLSLALALGLAACVLTAAGLPYLGALAGVCCALALASAW